MHAHLTTQARTKAAILSTLIACSQKSQRSIANDAGISPAHLNRILRGTTRPRDETFLKIIQATGTPPTTVGLALIVGPDNIPLLAQSDFMRQLCAELPTRLLEVLGDELIYADPRWAGNIVEHVVAKIEEVMARKRRLDSNLALNL
ncbi:MAG TPA: helix-turn-helix transcriptional regulator [Pedomonas sp.]|uniref:helix-turn-helix domain-containing protein n=1 Tax=Pedomonas sp. TaxID=2976421 RepID=UPI002F3F5E4C